MLATGSAIPDNVRGVILRFACHRNVGIPEARRIFVKCVETTKEIINADMELQPYLVRYPFTEEETDIAISFYNKNDNFISDFGFLSLVFICNGKIIYDVYNPRTGFFKTVYKEPYEKALAILRGECELLEERPDVDWRCY